MKKKAFKFKYAGNAGGSVLLITVFTIAVISVLVAGMLALTTEQVKLMNNQEGAAEAFEIAEAGLNDALAELRADWSWNSGFTNKPFAGGNYTIDVNSTNLPEICITSNSVTAEGYRTKLVANATINAKTPAAIRIDCLKVNPNEQ
jgi:Tfp pilus assembly protein PilX